MMKKIQAQKFSSKNAFDFFFELLNENLTKFGSYAYFFYAPFRLYCIIVIIIAQQHIQN